MSATPHTPTPSDAAARSFLWRYLGAAFSFPDEATVTWLNSEQTQATLAAAVGAAFLPRLCALG